MPTCSLPVGFYDRLGSLVLSFFLPLSLSSSESLLRAHYPRGEVPLSVLSARPSAYASSPLRVSRDLRSCESARRHFEVVVLSGTRAIGHQCPFPTRYLASLSVRPSVHTYVRTRRDTRWRIVNPTIGQRSMPDAIKSETNHAPGLRRHRASSGYRRT